MTTTNTTFLRRVLALDAVASGATGLLMAAGATLLEGITAIDADFARPPGLFLIAYAAAVAVLASRREPPARLVWAVIAVNLLWTVESVLTLLLGWIEPNALGVAFVLAQAGAVAGLAGLQVIGLKKAKAVAA